IPQQSVLTRTCPATGTGSAIVSTTSSPLRKMAARITTSELLRRLIRFPHALSRTAIATQAIPQQSVLLELNLAAHTVCVISADQSTKKAERLCATTMFAPPEPTS